jgi:hypothetical protein
LTALALSIILGFLHQTVLGQGFEVEGRNITTSFWQQPFGVSKTNRFNAHVSGCKWLIHVEENDPLRQIGSDSYTGTDAYFEAGSDGIEVCCLTVTKKEFLDQMLKDVKPEDDLKYRLKKEEPVAARGEIARGAIPQQDVIHNTRDIWFALASSCYLESLASEPVLPIFFYNLNSRRSYTESYQTRLERDTAFPMLPNRLMYIHDGIIDLSGGPGGQKSLPLPKPFDQGFTNFIFGASQFTNVGPYHIPMRFQREAWNITDVANPRLELVTRVAFVCDKVTLLNNGSLTIKPQFNRKMRIFDHRLENPALHIEKCDYETTGDWPGTNDTFFVRYKEALEGEAKERQGK